MGMFDYVDYEASCENCGSTLSDFQTKDTSCTLSTVSHLDCRNFYTPCDSCGAWNEFEVIPIDIVVERRTETLKARRERYHLMRETLNRIKEARRAEL